jgi:soluble lytic murein transglycosylase-like protein
MKSEADTVNRTRVLLLLPFALLALSGAPDGSAEAAAPPVTATADAPVVRIDLAARLRQLNPHLAASEVVRIEVAVFRYASSYGLDPLLVAAVIEVESSARPWARSPKGALGLMQVMPYMFRPMGLAGNPSTVEANIEAGCMILAANIRRLGEADGISAYFWGSHIRGVGYLNRVRAARERLQREVSS